MCEKSIIYIDLLNETKKCIKIKSMYRDATLLAGLLLPADID